jgi:hypothetical protein
MMDKMTITLTCRICANITNILAQPRKDQEKQAPMARIGVSNAIPLLLLNERNVLSVQADCGTAKSRFCLPHLPIKAPA